MAYLGNAHQYYEQEREHRSRPGDAFDAVRGRGAEPARGSQKRPDLLLLVLAPEAPGKSLRDLVLFASEVRQNAGRMESYFDQLTPSDLERAGVPVPTAAEPADGGSGTSSEARNRPARHRHGDVGRQQASGRDNQQVWRMLRDAESDQLERHCAVSGKWYPRGVPYRESLDALRRHYLVLIALRDELDASIDTAAGPLGDLYERRRAVTIELDDVASRIDLATRRPEPAAERQPCSTAGPFGRDALLALAIGSLIGIGIGVASQSHSARPSDEALHVHRCGI